MRAEYKRDVSHNYLILQEEKAVDTGIGRNTLRKLVEWKKLPV